MTVCSKPLRMADNAGGLAGAADESSAREYARKLTRTFSLQESDSSGVDQKELSNLQKVSMSCLAALL